MVVLCLLLSLFDLSPFSDFSLVLLFLDTLLAIAVPAKLINLASSSILLTQSISKRVAVRVRNTRIGGTRIGRQALGHRRRVEHTVHTRCRIILRQDKRVEVVAGGVAVCALSLGSSLVGGSQGGADAGADAGVVGLVVVGAADVGGGVVDGAGEGVGGVEGGEGGGGGVDQVVAVGAGDDDLELFAVLAVVCGCGFGGGDAPESALDVGEAGGSLLVWEGRGFEDRKKRKDVRSGVGASRSREESRVALVEEVEAKAATDAVTLGFAGGDAVAAQGVEAKVTTTSHGAIVVDKRPLVTKRSAGVDGSSIENGVVLETLDLKGEDW